MLPGKSVKLIESITSFEFLVLCILADITISGSARALEYLHEHSNPPVVHRDLKSSNVLLDSNFNAKVRLHSTDYFGMSLLLICLLMLSFTGF